MIFIETPIFTEDVMDLLSEEEYFAFQIHLTRNPDAGDLIIGTGGLNRGWNQQIDVAVGTLRNWEQGRRDPVGPARALLRAIQNDPAHVLAALQSDQAGPASAQDMPTHSPSC
ncbi:helix-turn-helix domain-containing protein [Pseudomonas sp. Marseille-Q5115]|uniref:helix-turn-helix domain-containing protein n=1 Tax=Pseudomonas sp. Marseille-Q5115 TaxID=2866593 RepID=UPI001CE45980|nr:hypothetical protein [Pseudomonas sp. Marseille-Q5115]